MAIKNFLKISEYPSWDGIDMALKIKQKEVSPRELYAEAFFRIDLYKEYNAIVTLMNKESEEQLTLLLEKFKNQTELPPLFGVPTLLKDLVCYYKGVPLTSGSRALKNFIPDFDSELVLRMKKSGLVILGKTNTPEFGIKGTTEPVLFGPAKNPWDQTRSPGGSSGGSAASVALGIVPFAHGNDGGGSIRIPASHCGLFGLKPTRGRNPLGPRYGEIIDGAVCEHFLTKSVRDSALLLDLTNGPEVGALFNIQKPEQSYLVSMNQNPKKLRIGFSKTSPLGGEVDPECLSAIDQTINLLNNLGHQVEETSININGDDLAKYFLIFYSAANSYTYWQIVKDKGEKFAKKNLEIETKMLALIGNTFSAREYVEAQEFKHQLALSFGIFFKTYDLFLTPTAATPPLKLGKHEMNYIEKLFAHLIFKFKAGTSLRMSGLVDKIGRENLDKVPFTQLANLTGNPSMSVPLYWDKNGLPIGSMFTAAFGEETILFQLARQLEEARPWKNKRPYSLFA